ncbi:MAG: hypothetical protein JOY99_13170 [Sphingomonadaceae bacterium]|nr:hypothetical protein [Sphingomonadaceae bacterium]
MLAAASAPPPTLQAQCIVTATLQSAPYGAPIQERIELSNGVVHVAYTQGLRTWTNDGSLISYRETGGYARFDMFVAGPFAIERFSAGDAQAIYTGSYLLTDGGGMVKEHGTCRVAADPQEGAGR